MKIETPILRRLGPVPFWRGCTKCLDELERIYRRARAAASARIVDKHTQTPTIWYNKGQNQTNET